nr:transaldolase isoform X3 [Syngnathus scovelli]
MRTLPDGTELICNKTEMTLVLPVASLSNINLTELQLNSPACPVIFNDTHLTARIALDGCGTKTVHAGTELVYTNTLKSVRPYSIISRRPSLIVPLACRIPAVQARGPNFNIAVPTTVFDDADVRLEFHLPGEGPLAIYTNHPQFKPLGLLPGRMRRDSAPVRHSRAFQAQLGSRVKELDLHLLSNTTVERAELNIKRCVQSGTDDFAENSIILENGCKASSTTKEIRATSHARIFRLDLSNLVTVQNMLYVKCELDLCISSLPSQKCARQCNQSFLNRSSVESKTFTVRSGPVSLVVTTPAPSSSVATFTSAAVEVTSTASAPGQVSFMAVGLILNIFCIYLQYSLIH